MAVSHNLSTITDNLSGFDPVAGETDGTTIGNGWLLWKLFEGLTAFDSTYKKITNASPTPSFLQGAVGSGFQTEPAKNSNATGNIRFYKTDDPGLSQATPSCFIHDWVDEGSYANLALIRFRHLVSGGTIYAPTNTAYVQTGAGVLNSLYYNGWSTTGTVMASIPKVIFWKSSNATAIMAINKSTGAVAGGALWFTPNISGYKHNVGAITQGLHSNVIFLINLNAGTHWIEGGTNESEADQSALVSKLSPICSAGWLPSSLFTFNSINNLIGGKLRMAVVNNSTYKYVSDEIEGVLLAHPTAAASAIGTILQFNTKYYLHWATISDGRANHRVLLELGT